MKYYNVSVVGSPLNSQFIVEGNTTKKEFKQWFNENYGSTIARIKEVDRAEIDPIWALYLAQTDNGLKLV